MYNWECLPRYSCLNLQTSLRLDFCLCGWTNSAVYERKADTPDQLLVRILDAAASIKKREDQRRTTTRDLRTRVAKCVEVGGGVFEK